MAKTKVEFIPTRRSLLTRLKSWDDQESWRVFFDTYWRLIYGVAVKAGLSDAEAQDVVQETVLSVARKMPDFKYDPEVGSFKAWLLKLTRWRIADQVKKRMKRLSSFHDETGKTSLLARLPDPSSEAVLDEIWEDEWQSNLMEVSLERVKDKAAPREFQIFQLYALQQWPVRKVASALGVSSAQVYIAKHRVAALLKKEITRLGKTGY